MFSISQSVSYKSLSPVYAVLSAGYGAKVFLADRYFHGAGSRVLGSQ